MKLATILLAQLLITSGGIYVYDELKADDPAPVTRSDDGYLEADGLHDPDAGESERTPEPLMSGGGTEMQIEGLQARISRLENQLADAIRAARSRATEGGEGADGYEKPGTGTAIDLGLADIGDPQDPNFDEETLDTLRAYVDEISRRKTEERNRERLAKQFARIDADMTEEQQGKVVDATLAYQKKARDLYRKKWPEGEAGRDQRRQALTDLKDEYGVTIKSLVPADTADKILESRNSNPRRFFSGGRTPARRGGGGR